MNIFPIQFLVGPDLFQRRIYLEEIKRALFPSGPTGFNDDTFDGKSTRISEILDLANTLPMMADRRLILIDNLDAPKEKDLDQLCAYIESPSPHSVLVAYAKKMDRRTKLAKLLAKKKYLISVEEPRPREMGIWLDRLLKKHDLGMNPDGRRTILESIGTDLSQMNQEIIKLGLYVHPNRSIPKAAIEELVLKTSGDNVFEWTDQIFSGDLSKATLTLNHLLSTGSPALVLVSMLSRHLRILIKARHHIAAGTPRAKLAPELGVPPFVLGKYTSQAEKLSLQSAPKALGILRKLDKEMKSTGLPTNMLLERSMRDLATTIHS